MMKISRIVPVKGQMTIDVENEVSIIPLTTVAAVGFDCFDPWDEASAEYRAGIGSMIMLLLSEGYTLYLFASSGKTSKGGQGNACTTWKAALTTEFDREIKNGQIKEIYADPSSSGHSMLPSLLRWMMGHPDDLKEAHCYWFTDQVRRNTRAIQLTRAIAKVKFQPSNRRVNGLRRPDKSWKSTWWAQRFFSWLSVK